MAEQDDHLSNALADALVDEVAAILTDGTRSDDDHLAALCSLLAWHNRMAGAA